MRSGQVIGIFNSSLVESDIYCTLSKFGPQIAELILASNFFNIFRKRVDTRVNVLGDLVIDLSYHQNVEHHHFVAFLEEMRYQETKSGIKILTLMMRQNGSLESNLTLDLEYEVKCDDEIITWKFLIDGVLMATHLLQYTPLTVSISHPYNFLIRMAS
jgi:hypothetical protein